MTASPEVLLPASEQEAVEAFGDGSGVTVVAGGTIVMPEINHGRLTPAKALLLNRAGLAGVERTGSTVTIGAMTPVSELVDLPSPLGPAAANVADFEVRAQGTVGGNVCADPGVAAPRGDLQGALLALGASVRFADAGRVRDQPIEEFLGARGGRLVLAVSFEEPSAGGYARVDRPHAHTYTALAVSAARAANGTVRIAATGAGPHGLRLSSAEEKSDDPEAAGQAALGDVTFEDDALASAWYRERTLPVLVRRALTQLRESG